MKMIVSDARIVESIDDGAVRKGEVRGRRKVQGDVT
jgi:hypothetical protein